MTIQDILNKPETIKIDGNEYKLEYDHKALGMVELQTNKSIYKIYDLIFKDNNLMFLDSVEVVCGGLLKHHTEKEITEARTYMLQNPSFWNSNNDAILTAFAKVMMPPEIFNAIKPQEATNEAEKK